MLRSSSQENLWTPITPVSHDEHIDNRVIAQQQQTTNQYHQEQGVQYYQEHPTFSGDERVPFRQRHMIVFMCLAVASTTVVNLGLMGSFSAKKKVFPTKASSGLRPASGAFDEAHSERFGNRQTTSAYKTKSELSESESWLKMQQEKPTSSGNKFRGIQTVKNYVTPIGASGHHAPVVPLLMKHYNDVAQRSVTIEGEDTPQHTSTIGNNKIQDISQTNEADSAKKEDSFEKVPGSPYITVDEKRVSTAVGRAPPLNGYKNTWDARDRKDVAVFWQIPNAGSTPIKDIVSSCHQVTMASEAGITGGHGKDTMLAMVKIDGPAESGMHPSRFVNVDTTTTEGLERAIHLGLIRSELASIMVTPFIYEPESLFDAARRGRLFALFRHPVDRAVSMYTYLQNTVTDPIHAKALASMTIEQYAESSYAEDNWLTRYLSNDPENELTNAHVEVAKDMIRRKFLIGLADRREESMERFEKFFGWKYIFHPEKQEECRSALLAKGDDSDNPDMLVPKLGSYPYELLSQKNLYDIELYEYVVALFADQEQFVADVPDGFRQKGATCCMCNAIPCA